MAVFLVDAHLSRRLVKRLVEAGHAATHVFDHLPGTATDIEVAELANHLGAAVIGKDADFADLARRGVLRTTFIWIRSGNIKTDRLWRGVAPLLPDILGAIEAGQKVVEVR